MVRYGDTDIFPFPVERQIVRDKKKEVLKILLEINKHFQESVLECDFSSNRTHPLSHQLTQGAHPLLSF